MAKLFADDIKYGPKLQRYVRIVGRQRRERLAAKLFVARIEAELGEDCADSKVCEDRERRNQSGG